LKKKWNEACETKTKQIFDEKSGGLQSQITNFHMDQADSHKQLQSLVERSHVQMEEMQKIRNALTETQNIVGYSKALLMLQEAQKKSPNPFHKELQTILKLSSSDPLLKSAVAAIPVGEASKGIKTIPKLREEFHTLTETVKETALRNLLSGGDQTQILSKIKDAANPSSPKGLSPGNDEAAVLSRCGYHLDRGSLEPALREIAHLQPPTADIFARWVEQAKARSQLDTAVAIFSTHIYQEIASQSRSK